MRNLRELDAYRQRSPRVIEMFGSFGDEGTGVFILPSPGGDLLCIASDGEGWDHVSVSLKHRCPNWPEMDHVKRVFFKDDETAMQLHVPPDEHISFAHTTLHLWRSQTKEIPRPPNELVGAPKPRDSQLSPQEPRVGAGSLDFPSGAGPA